MSNDNAAIHRTTIWTRSFIFVRVLYKAESKSFKNFVEKNPKIKYDFKLWTNNNKKNKTMKESLKE